MGKVLFCILFFCMYLIFLFVLKKEHSNQLGIFFILIAIAINIELNVYDEIYINLFASVILIMVIAVSNYGLLLNSKRYGMVGARHANIKSFYIMLLPLMIILSNLIVQYMFIEIINLRLFFHQVLMFLMILLMVVWFFIVSLNSNFAQNNSIIFNSILIISILNALLAIMQYIFNKSFLLSSPGESIDYFEGVRVVKRVWGFVGASNGAGNLGAILFAVLLYCFYKKRNIITFSALLLNVIFVGLTLTRIAYFAVFIECLIFIFFVYGKNLNYKKLFMRLMMTILIVVVTTISLYVFYDSAYELLISDRGATGEHRFIQFKKVFEISKENLLVGIGAGQYVYKAYSHYGFNDIVVHSQFLNTLVEQGLISFLAHLFFYVYTFKLLMRRFKNEIWFPIMLFVGNFITSNFNPNQYYDVSILIYVFISLGLIFFENDYEKNEFKA
ncbi:O-antigen ligase family protein [Bacillus thuringiensis]